MHYLYTFTDIYRVEVRGYLKGLGGQNDHPQPVKMTTLRGVKMTTLKPC
ncbi:hypothetical protein QO012_002560 [Methylobacterium aerolatum]|uniref:Uncharacterized protein n=1 Tax=Methylobacterium aerolatum TaxID=418708 RepID=A0ABU0I0C5_9HYPH|nr:hypothetical protein [Methylobacterium aerolatum]GJD36474.1 hypothetical protein FMGBMHLM_3394 [Methylobacterium aerolatum]